MTSMINTNVFFDVRSTILCAQRDQHTAKKTLVAHATTLKQLGARCLAKSMARGGKERHGYVSDLDVQVCQVDVALQLAALVQEEAVGLQQRSSPWEEEWAKCEQMYQTNVEWLESVHDRGFRLPRVLQQWAAGVAVLFGDNGHHQQKRLALLERALFFAQLRQHLLVPNARLPRPSLLGESCAIFSIFLPILLAYLKWI